MGEGFLPEPVLLRPQFSPENDTQDNDRTAEGESLMQHSVVLLCNSSLLSAGVRRLLDGVDDVQLKILSAGEPEWAAKLKELGPRTILVDASDDSLGDKIVTQMLSEHPDARVIAVSLGRSSVDIYRVNRVQKIGAEGLLNAIRESQLSEEASEFPSTERAQAGGGAMIK